MLVVAETVAPLAGAVMLVVGGLCREVEDYSDRLIPMATHRRQQTTILLIAAQC